MKTLVLWDITGSIAPACGSVDCLLSECQNENSSFVGYNGGYCSCLW